MIDEEKFEDRPGSPPASSKSDSSPHPRKEFQLEYSNSRRNSLVNRTRSNNGYGCDEGIEDNVIVSDGNDLEGHTVEEKDPFEVHWDGGDSDPMNPRRHSKARKWVVVLLVSASSLCV